MALISGKHSFIHCYQYSFQLVSYSLGFLLSKALKHMTILWLKKSVAENISLKNNRKIEHYVYTRKFISALSIILNLR